VKKTAVAVAVFVCAALMVLPIVRSVNLPAGKPVTIDRTLSADGWPLPWPGPPVALDNTSLTADGWPLPWPGPPVAQDSDSTSLIADGWPLPWPGPPQSAVAV